MQNNINSAPPEEVKESASAKLKKAPPEPISEAFAPLLLCGISMLLGLLAFIIDKFLFPFSAELLSPVLCQILILILPSYLYLSAAAPERSFTDNIKSLRVCGFRAENIFFLIFATAFMICSSFTLDALFGGVYLAADGFTLMGIITAGESEYSVSTPYLVICYAIVPAIAEEIFFRGIIFKEFEKRGFVFATVISSLIYAVLAYNPGQIPAALVSGAIFAAALSVTGSLSACILMHLIYNAYGLFLQPNLSQYLISSQNNTLLVTVLLLALTATAALFFGELARIYRKRSAGGDLSLRHRRFKTSSLPIFAKGCLAHKPTLITAIICGAIYVATVTIRILL